MPSSPGLFKTLKAVFGDREICDRCGATLDTYVFTEACSADLDDHCPGFIAIEAALKPTGDDRRN